MAANMLLPGAILAVDLAVHGTDFAVVTPGNNVQSLLGLTYRVSSSMRVSCLTTRSLGATARGEQAVAAAFTPEGRVVLQRRDEAVQAMVAERERSFREEAPMTAAAAAKVILDGVKAERWRILVGHDAERLDAWVRNTPEEAYEPDFHARFATEIGWKLG